MNKCAFIKNTNRLIKILESSTLNEKEKAFRKEKLNSCHEKMMQSEIISSKYYQITHEIDSMLFLQKFGDVIPTCDSEHQKGCDFKLNNKYYIECVCSSAGEEKDALNQFNNCKGLYDYRKKQNIINSRFTSSLLDKVIFYEERKDESISLNTPYLIFLSLGELAYETSLEENGALLTEILFGRGKPQMTIEKHANENKIVDFGYSHNESFKKSNGSDIACNLFIEESFSCVSAILCASSLLTQDYDSTNTFLYINPNASNPINESDFNGIIFWSEDKLKGVYSSKMNGERVHVPQIK